MSTWVIYCHTHIASGKRYVGQSVQGMAYRWRSHTFAARNGSPLPFHRAIAKYGPDAFAHEILETVSTIDAANEAEIKWIGRHACIAPNGYNLRRGGDAKITHDDTRARMRAAQVAMGPERLSERGRRGGLGNSSETQSARARAKYADLTASDRSALSRGTTTPEQRSAVARARQAAKTSEQRSATAKTAADAYWANATPEQRAESGRKKRERMLSRTEEQRSAHACALRGSQSADQLRAAQLKGVAARLANSTFDQRSEAIKSMWSSKTPEQKSEIAQKRWATRRANAKVAA